MPFDVKDPDYKEKIEDSFYRQDFMNLLGAKLTRVEPGLVEAQLDYKGELTQQHKYFHGGVIGALADTVGGYAAFTLTPPDSTVLSVEYKLSFVNPGNGQKLIARGEVIKAGKQLSTCSANVYVEKDSIEKICATALVTIMNFYNKSDH